MSGLVVKKASSPAGLILIVLIVIILPALLLVLTHYEPVSPGTFQAQLLGVLHGGIRSDFSDSNVEGCVAFDSQRITRRPDGTLIQDTVEYWAVHHVTRTIIFGDRSELTITFSERYKNPQCLEGTQ